MMGVRRKRGAKARVDEQKPDMRRERGTSSRLTAKSISIKRAGRKSGDCARKAAELTSGDLCYASGNSILIPPAYGSYSTLGRHVFRSMPYYNWDFSLTKAGKFRERLTTQFRAEFFNVLNHPNISNPFGGPGGGSSFTDPSATKGASFGFRPETPDVTSSNPVLGSGGPRAIQLGLKIIF